MVAMKEPRRLEHRRRSGSFDAELQRRSEMSVRVVASPKAGDAIEELLTSYGITKEWYQGFKKEHGLPPTCNCEARKKWISEFASKYPAIESMATKLMAALARR